MTGSSATTHDHQRTLQIAVIIFCLAAAVAVLFVIAGERPSIRRDDGPILHMQAAGTPDSLEADTVETPADTGIPDLWTQPRGLPGGNPACSAKSTKRSGRLTSQERPTHKTVSREV